MKALCLIIIIIIIVVVVIPFCVQRNLSFGTPLLKGHLHSGDTKFDPGKMLT